MTAAVLVPWRPGDPHRARNWAWCRHRWDIAGLQVIEGADEGGEFSRTQAILDARARTDADVLVVADADVWCDDLGLDQLDTGWAIPHLVHRLSEPSTRQLLDGHPDWRTLPLSADNPQDQKPYRVHPAGTLLTLTAATFDAAPPDSRFVGWGQEDDAWAAALAGLVGPPRRTTADVVHLWHPPQARRSRRVGNTANQTLARRYRDARRSPERMRALIEEARCSPTSASTTPASPGC